MLPLPAPYTWVPGLTVYQIEKAGFDLRCTQCTWKKMHFWSEHATFSKSRKSPLALPVRPTSISVSLMLVYWNKLYVQQWNRWPTNWDITIDYKGVYLHSQLMNVTSHAQMIMPPIKWMISGYEEIINDISEFILICWLVGHQVQFGCLTYMCIIV